MRTQLSQVICVLPTSSRAIANVRFQVRHRNQSLTSTSGGEHDQPPLWQREESRRKRSTGELATRLLLTLAYDAALEIVERRTYQGHNIERYFTTPVPLLTFLSALFARPHMENIDAHSWHSPAIWPSSAERG